MTFSFANLSLSGITASAGASVLPAGRYVCKIGDVEIKDTKAGNGKVMKVQLRCEAGVITDNLNVYNTSQEAVRIGLEQLKSLLVCSGHPDPDNIGQHGLASMKGLTVGVIVKADTYNGAPSSKVAGYCKADAIGATPAAAAAASFPSIGNGGMPF
jgi:hypothetical protein